MRKLLLIIFIVFSVTIPAKVFAVQDVVLSTNVNVTLDSPAITLIIQNTTVDQIVVNTGNVVITMSAGGSAVTITTTSRYQFTVSGITNPGTVCSADQASLTLPVQASAVAVTITPSTVCPTTGGSSGPAYNPAPPPPSAPSTATGDVVATPSLGGNTYINTSELTTAKVDVPAGALSQETSFSINTIAKSSSVVAGIVAAVPVDKRILGSNIFDYKAVAGGTSVTSFTKNITVSFTYTEAQLVGLDENSLRVYYFDEARNVWEPLLTTLNKNSKTVSAVTNHFTRFAILAAAVEGTEPPIVKPVSVSLVDVNGSAIVDGDLISTADSFDIYIVKLVGSKKFKRLILNPDIFNSYGHLSWNNVKTVSQAVQDAYMLADLVIEVNEDGSVFDPKVYKVSSALNSDVGTKQWLNMTAAQFEATGYDWDAIYKINHTEASPNFYPEGTPIIS